MSNFKKILVLGHTGLLGNMVANFLESKNEFIILKNNFRWNTQEFKEHLSTLEVDMIVNCIGAIHQRTNDFSINYELPIFLDTLGVKVIHPGTDCEMDDDEYGLSKRGAKDFIVNESKNTKIIKTSIIGHELNSNYSLMNWFLSNPDGSSVNGFTNHYWNGNTTLTWAKFCLELINNWSDYDVETILYSDCISKFEILKSINKVYNRRITINQFEATKSVNKCLVGQIKTPHIEEQLNELKKFIENEIK